MPTMRMLVQSIEPPGKSRRVIVGVDPATNQTARVGAFKETVGLFQAGVTYDIEYTESTFEGRTLRNVKSATAIEAMPVKATSTAAPSAATGFGTQSSSEFNRQTHPTDAERMWVCSILNAAIQSGRVPFDKQSLAQATLMLRGLWRYAFVESEQSTFVSGAARIARG